MIDPIKNQIRRWSALVFLAAGLAALALPQFRLLLSDRAYSLTGGKILASAILYREQLVRYPIILKLAMAGVLLSLAVSLVLALLRKTQLAALLAIAAPVLSFLAFLLAGSLETTLKALGAGQVQLSPQAGWLLSLILPVLAGLLLLWGEGTETLAASLFQASAILSVASVAMITAYMLVAGLPAILEIGPLRFLSGTVWKPTQDVNPQFGILPMMLATLAGTAGAVLIGVPVGLLTAVFLAEIAPRRLAALVRPAVELLAGIPSVIYGFFGLQMLVPLVQKTFGLPTGATLFSAILILAVMILPTIVSTAETGLRAVPAMYREASLAIGATRIETIFKVVIPAARSSVLSGVILGVGRAIGETMAVIMVAGNIPNLPALFSPARPLTVGIALEMSYASGLHQKALFAIGLILFLFIMIVNLTFSWLSKKGVQMSGAE